MPRMVLVDSSVIEAIGYDDARQELHVRFVGSRSYVYEGVDPVTFGEFAAAESKGTYFNRVIRPRGYRYEQRD